MIRPDGSGNDDNGNGVDCGGNYGNENGNGDGGCSDDNGNEW